MVSLFLVIPIVAFRSLALSDSISLSFTWKPVIAVRTNVFRRKLIAELSISFLMSIWHTPSTLVAISQNAVSHASVLMLLVHLWQRCYIRTCRKLKIPIFLTVLTSNLKTTFFSQLTVRRTLIPRRISSPSSQLLTRWPRSTTCLFSIRVTHVHVIVLPHQVSNSTLAYVFRSLWVFMIITISR